MDYGFWFLFTDELGHAKDFHGPFDYFMDFFFYLPNLLVAEVFIRRKQLFTTSSTVVRYLVNPVLYLLTLSLLLATYFFTVHLWGPANLDLFI